MPEVEGFLATPRAPKGDELDTRGFGKGKDVFGSPVFVILVKRINDRSPGVDVHDVSEHFREVNLRDEALEKMLVDLAGGVDKFGELGSDVLYVEVFGVGNDVDVGVVGHELEKVGDVEWVVFTVPEGRHEVGVSKIGGGGGVLVLGLMSESAWTVARSRQPSAS